MRIRGPEAVTAPPPSVARPAPPPGFKTVAGVFAPNRTVTEALRGHGFSDEDIWDIGAIAAFFALSNRMANLISMRPNDEFYLLGRVPRK